MAGKPQLFHTKQQKKSSSIISTKNLVVLAGLLRIGFFSYGLYQDQTMAVPYTDIDYLVFTDAADYLNKGLSPYLRETYRYTPVLAWLLLPNVNGLYSFGKWLFMACDILTGLLILKVLELSRKSIDGPKRLVLASIWLLNPMVITISTRGSSESVLTVFVMLFVYFLLKGDTLLSGVFAGLSIHFKIYPIIYIPTAILYLADYRDFRELFKEKKKLLNSKIISFVLAASITFLWLGFIMFFKYGKSFLEHSYLYHFARIDHRHNFSVYNISLYFSSALHSKVDLTKLAFLPQLLISGVLIPLAFTKKSFTSTLFLQTFAFVTFNKVITSQYFIWFLIFLPIHLGDSKLLNDNKLKGIASLLVWIGSQASWLFFAYKLEFLGESTFFPGLLGSSVLFFFGNAYVLGVLIDDTANKESSDGL